MSQIKPVNKILISIPKEFEDEIVLDSGLKLFKDASYQREWNASITGRVAMLSDLVSEENKEIYDELDLGMEVAFDYKIIADFDFASDEKQFHCITPEGQNHLRKYVNKLGFWISVRSVPNPKGVVANRIFSLSGDNSKATQEKTWVGWLQDKHMNIVDGVQGNDHDLERWLSQFSFGKIDQYIFRNKVFIDQKEYWVADFQQIIARKIQGEWVAMGDYLICAPLVVDVSKKVSLSSGGLHIPESAIQLKFRDRAILLHENKEMGLRKHDVIAFQEEYLYPNIIENQEYFFIKKRHVDGVYPIN